MSCDYEIQEVPTRMKKGREVRVNYKRVMLRGKMVGIILDGRPNGIVFTGHILGHECDGLMEWFSGIIGEEGVERHPPILEPEPYDEQEDDFDL